MTTVYDLESVSIQFVGKASRYITKRFEKFGVEYDDVAAEMWIWLNDKGQVRVERWLSSDPQQTTRIYRSLLDVGIALAEREKAAYSGYEPHDQARYSAQLVTDLMTDVTDSNYPGKAGVSEAPSGDWLAMVLDVRRVLTKHQHAFFLFNEETHPEWSMHVNNVVERLNNYRPAKRKVLSNEQAQAITAEAC